MTRTRDTADHLKDRVVEALDARRKEHDTQRNSLKLEWTKMIKAVVKLYLFFPDETLCRMIVKRPMKRPGPL